MEKQFNVGWDRESTSVKKNNSKRFGSKCRVHVKTRDCSVVSVLTIRAKGTRSNLCQCRKFGIKQMVQSLYIHNFGLALLSKVSYGKFNHIHKHQLTKRIERKSGFPNSETESSWIAWNECTFSLKWLLITPPNQQPHSEPSSLFQFLSKKLEIQEGISPISHVHYVR